MLIFPYVMAPWEPRTFSGQCLQSSKASNCINRFPIEDRNSGTNVMPPFSSFMTLTLSHLHNLIAIVNQLKRRGGNLFNPYYSVFSLLQFARVRKCGV